MKLLLATCLAIDLHGRLNRHDEALALCTEAAGRFPALQARLADLRSEHAAREASHWAELDRQRREQAAADLLTWARLTSGQGADSEVIAVCGTLLEDRPDHPEALALRARAYERLGHLDEALALYRRLRVIQPGNPTWSRCMRDLQGRRSVPTPGQEREVLEIFDETTAAGETGLPGRVTPEPPDISWASVAGEFLQDHWQKLILCLAVLLILVSSTVGAHLLLGPRLWSPAGKCILALVYTVMFAALGAGLLRWGAERAGRMMLVTTLIVVPINFMLAGELRLLIEPTASRLAVLALDAAALWLLTRVVAATLDVQGGRFLAVALFALGACNAATARGIPLRWGLAAFLLPPGIFWARSRGSTPGSGPRPSRSTAASPISRWGCSPTRSSPARSARGLRAAPGAPAVRSAGDARCDRRHPHGATPAAVRQGRAPSPPAALRRPDALGAAFALALARPPGPSALFSGNTLATALLGLALYATALAAYRQPAYLYFSFAALFLAYFVRGAVPGLLRGVLFPRRPDPVR